MESAKTQREIVTETQREWAKELTNFHHRISFHNRSLVFGNIKRCGIIRISSLAMWVLVYVKMCATYNRPLYVYPHGNLSYSPSERFTLEEHACSFVCTVSMKFMDNGLAALSTVFLLYWEKPMNIYTHSHMHTVRVLRDKNYGEDTSFPSSALHIGPFSLSLSRSLLSFSSHCFSFCLWCLELLSVPHS